VNEEELFASLERVYKEYVGGWACTAMLAGTDLTTKYWLINAGFGLDGFRDPYSIRLLVLGLCPTLETARTT
jgi:amidophosphoribosyltransferase